MSFGEFYAATSGLGKAYSDGAAQFDKKQMLGALGSKLQAGDYAGASKVAFDAGDPDTGLSLLKLGQSAKQSADANAAFNSFGQSYAGGGTPQSLGTLGAQPAAPPTASRPGASLPSFAQGSDIGRYAGAIQSNESGGNYGIVGPTHPKYGRALGAYQVMESNLPSWSREAIGREVTPDEFLKSPQIQDAIFQKKFGQAVEKYGNPQDAASVWFTGRPLAQGANARDVLGTTGQRYVDKFTAALGRGAPAAAPQLPATAMQMPPPAPAAQTAPVQVASADRSFVPTMPGATQTAPASPALPSPSPGTPTMTMPGADSAPAAAPEATPEARAQVSAAVPQQLAQAGLPPAAAQQVGATAPASQQRIGALIRLATMPGLSEGQSGVVKTLLSNELEQTKAPDEVKKYLFARGQGYGGSFVDFQREGQRPVGPQTVSAGSALVDPNTGRVIFQAPDKEGGGVTLSPGQVRFDAQGRRIAEVADRDKSNEGEAKLRTEFTKQLGTFGEVQDGYRRLIAATEQRESNPGAVSPASDIGLVFGFMKMLDPGSVVREGEFASAQNAAGVPERIQNLYNKALNGEILNPTQRQDFIDTAQRLYGQARQGAESVATRYSDLAKGQGLDVGRVVALPPALSAPKVGRPKASTPEAAPKFKEGTVIVNPQTNEELVRRGGQWVPNARSEL